MNGALLIVAVFVGLLIGPAALAGIGAFVAGRTRVGVFAAVILLSIALVYAVRNPVTESGGEPIFSVALTAGLLAAFVLMPSFALAVVAAFIGAALKRNSRPETKTNP